MECNYPPKYSHIFHLSSCHRVRLSCFKKSKAEISYNLWCYLMLISFRLFKLLCYIELLHTETSVCFLLLIRNNWECCESIKKEIFPTGWIILNCEEILLSYYCEYDIISVLGKTLWGYIIWLDCRWLAYLWTGVVGPSLLIIQPRGSLTLFSSERDDQVIKCQKEAVSWTTRILVSRKPLQYFRNSQPPNDPFMI